MRDHTRLRAFELADEVRLDSVRAQLLTAFSLQPKHLSSYTYAAAAREKSECSRCRCTSISFH
jgi:hypothetical protein